MSAARLYGAMTSRNVLASTYRLFRKNLAGNAPAVEERRGNSTVFRELISSVTVPVVLLDRLRTSVQTPVTVELETVPKNTLERFLEPAHERQLPTCLR
jgi:hypothetical protein